MGSDPRGGPVACLSVGGTKLQAGVLEPNGRFFARPELHWRADAELAERATADDPGDFCDALAAELAAALAGAGRRWGDLAVVGVAFPGPEREGRWLSTNLGGAFRRGVALAAALRAAVERLAGRTASRVAVAFDAACDAGGELYHPRGRLRGDGGPALVLNLATGIAAGLVRGGRVLTGDAAFADGLGSGYDGNAGQLGRHLWVEPESGAWSYHYRPGGAIPESAPGVRMTDWLSGPALAARLLRRLVERGVEPPEAVDGSVGRVRAAAPGELAGAMRVRPRREVVELLTWADRTSVDRSATAAEVQRFVRTAARELAAALDVLRRAPGWAPFERRVVLTGGIGIHFMAGSELFLSELAGRLPATRWHRSELTGATERESYLFLRQEV